MSYGRIDEIKRELQQGSLSDVNKQLIEHCKKVVNSRRKPGEVYKKGDLENCMKNEFRINNDDPYHPYIEKIVDDIKISKPVWDYLYGCISNKFNTIQDTEQKKEFIYILETLKPFKSMGGSSKSLKRKSRRKLRSKSKRRSIRKSRRKSKRKSKRK